MLTTDDDSLRPARRVETGVVIDAFRIPIAVLMLLLALLCVWCAFTANPPISFSTSYYPPTGQQSGLVPWLVAGIFPALVAGGLLRRKRWVAWVYLPIPIVWSLFVAFYAYVWIGFSAGDAGDQVVPVTLALAFFVGIPVLIAVLLFKMQKRF